MLYRNARASDLEPIIALHVEEQWRAYAHILPAGYLREEMPAQKRVLWSARLAPGAERERLSILVAESDARQVVGFICFVLEPNDAWGSYLHNLYVASSHQRQGIARRLLVEGVSGLGSDVRAAPVHLLVYRANEPARALYERLGGAPVERFMRGDPPVELFRYQWASADVLLQRAGAGLSPP